MHATAPHAAMPPLLHARTVCSSRAIDRRAGRERVEREALRIDTREYFRHHHTELATPGRAWHPSVPESNSPHTMPRFVN